VCGPAVAAGRGDGAGAVAVGAKRNDVGGCEGEVFEIKQRGDIERAVNPSYITYRNYPKKVVYSFVFYVNER
jgi:hypothetical protein